MTCHDWRKTELFLRLDLPYEAPEDADLVVDLTKDTVPEIVHGKRQLSIFSVRITDLVIYSHHPLARDSEPCLDEPSSTRKRPSWPETKIRSTIFCIALSCKDNIYNIYLTKK